MKIVAISGTELTTKQSVVIWAAVLGVAALIFASTLVLDPRD
jgi:hypothetical protein